MNTIDAQAEAAAKKPAAAKGRKLYLSVNAPIEAVDEPEPGSHLKRIFVLLLLVHVFLVGGIIVYNILRQQSRPQVAESSAAMDKKPVVTHTLATGSAAKPAVRALTAPVAVGEEYIVKVGDTLRGIAETNNIDEGELCAVNGISPETKLDPGRPIHFPKKAAPAPEKAKEAAVVAAAPVPAPKPTPAANTTTSSPAQAKAEVKVAKQETSPDAPPAPTKTVVLNAPPAPNTQDHPPGPAKGVSEPAGKKIADKTPEKSADKPADKPVAKAKEDSKPKEEAKPKVAKEEPAKVDKNAKLRSYTVSPKDTFYSISKKFGVNVNELMKINNVKDPGKLHEGTKLKIPAKS